MIAAYMKYFDAVMRAELATMRLERAADELLRGLNDLSHSEQS